MQQRTNRRGHDETYTTGRHLNLEDLKREVEPVNTYLEKENIPAFPQPEFQVCRLKHDTDAIGLVGINKDKGFKNPGYDTAESKSELLWWSLVVGPEEIDSAETRFLETTYPDRTEEQVQSQPEFLEKFATSPAFQRESRMGSYRFTFPLKELLNAYSQQFCSGAQPVMRVYETILYKQEVVYTVLVHSPANQEKFSDYPLLPDDPNAICSYSGRQLPSAVDGRFIWRPQAMCETHRWEMIQRPEEKQIAVQYVPHLYYVWDNVAVALHVEKQVLKFDPNRLRENLKFCNRDDHGLGRSTTFEYFEKAKNNVGRLWPDYPTPLEVDE